MKSEHRPNLILLALIAIGFAFMAADWIVIYGHEFRVLLSSTVPFVWWRLAEAALLAVIAMGFMVCAVFLWIGTRSGLRPAIVMAGVLLALAFTDVVEAHAGAWCRPWWILVYRVPCAVIVLVLTVRAIFAWCHRRESAAMGRPPEPAA